ncbi:serine/threonine-protein phosphatase, partial [Leptolyngbya sp. FACHB-36]|uniref:PP2C family protein-serine/threonine phosphatase n=1 Tax=Leptolyngbya sp. FACHB-36 TaxID=2692808 RepID=UPI0016802831
GTVLKLLNTADPIPPVVVCDGIGGHEGGNVASSLAIETIQQQLSAVPPGATINAATLIAQLDQVALAANDAISQRNDQEHRQDRQRMGTTLVMALVHTHELYLTHVGDSRAYRITRTGCHQVTLDDDLASRETRLGYALYRDALQHPGSGSLVQALGMGASSLLHPTVQRFVLDEDCVFLLCSDGLSDHDRVEEYWQTELVPILNGTIDLATAGQRLVDLANTKNGHDNVTIGLVYCQVLPSSGATQPHAAATAPLDASLARLPANTLRASSKAVNSTSKTQLVQPQRRNRRSLVIPLGILALWALGGALAYFLIPDVHVWIDSLVSPRPSPSIAVAPVASPVSPPPASVPPPLAVGALVQVNAAAPTNAEAVTSSTIALLAQPSTKSSSPAIARSVPPGSILKLSTRRTRAEDSSNWLQFTVCSVPTTPKSSTPLVQAGETGWIRESAIAPLITPAASSSCSTTPRQTPSPSP